MVNILYVSPFARIGGGEVSILTTINNLDKGAFRSFLACYEEGPFVESARAGGIKTVVFKRGGLVSELSVIRNLIRHMKTNDIRLVHVNSLDIRAGIAAALARVPCVGHLRVIFPLTWRDRLFVRLARVTIAVSKAAVDAFCRKPEQCRDRFIVMPNMVDVSSEVKPALLKEEFGLRKDVPLVGMVGRMDPFKGHSIFIDAAAIIKKSIPNAKFFIIGGPSGADPDEEDYLEAQKRHVTESGLKDDFVFTGFRKEILSAIAGLDLLIIPSTIIQKGSSIATEGFGRVAIEAMAVGTPVVSSNAGGLVEIIENGVSGVIVPMDDPAATAAAVIDLLRNRQKADSIKIAAKKRFDELYSTKCIAKLQDLYLNIVNKEHMSERQW